MIKIQKSKIRRKLPQPNKEYLLKKKKSTVDVICNHKHRSFSPQDQEQGKDVCSHSFFKILLEVSASAVKEEK